MTEREKLVRAAEDAEKSLAVVNDRRRKAKKVYMELCAVVAKAIADADAKQEALRKYDATHRK